MDLIFEFTFPPITEQEIIEFESKYGVQLPKSYKRFLLLNNGGKTEKRRFKTVDGKITSSAKLFLPISNETDLNLQSFYEKYCIKKIIPSHLIPIAIDPNESLICLSIKEQDKVYYCDMDYFEEDGNVLLEENIRLVSDNFNSFLNNLYKPK